MGGLAGGLKYKVHDILFKFPLNVHHIYSDHEAAAKVAAHELKGIG